MGAQSRDSSLALDRLECGTWEEAALPTSYPDYILAIALPTILTRVAQNETGQFRSERGSPPTSERTGFLGHCLTPANRFTRSSSPSPDRPFNLRQQRTGVIQQAGQNVRLPRKLFPPATKRPVRSALTDFHGPVRTCPRAASALRLPSSRQCCGSCEIVGPVRRSPGATE